jgi:hypothetical protein
MSEIQLDSEVMKCFEDAIGVLKSDPERPLDAAAVSSILMEVGEAVCMQVEKTRVDILESHARIERMLESQQVSELSADHPEF